MGVINADDLDWIETTHADSTWRRKQLGDAADGESIGCSLYELPPGKRSWPYHFHTANEEAVFVLAGSGTLRLGGDTLALEAGDYVALPAGEQGAHRLSNDGDVPFRYLMVSTMVEPDITVYPDSNKIGVFAGAPPGGSGDRSVTGYYHREDAVDYWDGEA